MTDRQLLGVLVLAIGVIIIIVKNMKVSAKQEEAAVDFKNMPDEELKAYYDKYEDSPVHSKLLESCANELNGRGIADFDKMSDKRLLEYYEERVYYEEPKEIYQAEKELNRRKIPFEKAKIDEEEACEPVRKAKSRPYDRDRYYKELEYNQANEDRETNKKAVEESLYQQKKLVNLQKTQNLISIVGQYAIHSKLSDLNKEVKELKEQNKKNPYSFKPDYKDKNK